MLGPESSTSLPPLFPNVTAQVLIGFMYMFPPKKSLPVHNLNIYIYIYIFIYIYIHAVLPRQCILASKPAVQNFQMVLQWLRGKNGPNAGVTMHSCLFSLSKFLLALAVQTLQPRWSWLLQINLSAQQAACKS